MDRCKRSKNVRTDFRPSPAHVDPISRCVQKQGWMNINVRHLLTVSLLTVRIDTSSQGRNYKRTFTHGLLLQILRLIIILHIKRNIVEPRVGLFKVAHFENGKKMVLCYGFGATVCLFFPLCLEGYSYLPDSLAGVGKSILWYASFRLFL
jgi:hypothetical protein